MRFRAHQEAAQASTRRLVALFVIVLALLVLAVNAVLAVAYWASMPFAPFPAFFFETNTGIVLLFVLGGCWFETLRLRDGGAHVARMAGGRMVQAASGRNARDGREGPTGYGPADRLERRFANIVQELALAARVPAPAAWVLPREDAINAFAAGWSTDDAVVAVTRGALERLTREELQGVVAHEFSHLVHGDTRLNMRLIGLVWGLQMLFLFGRMLAARDELRRQPPAAYLFGLALMGVGSLGWAAGRLLQAAVSRQREFLADASAVKYTRLVAGIGGALRKIADQARRHGDRLHAPQVGSLAHLMLSRPGRRSWWWSTHPPIGERLRRLYGRDPGPLAADLLPPPAEDDAGAARFAAAASAPAQRPDAGPALPAPEAHRHDALQNPALQGAAEREREALARIDRWHGPGERAAALMMLIAGPGRDATWAAAHQAAAHLGVAPAVRRELGALRPAARTAALELLAARTAAAPRDERRALLRSAAPLATSRVSQLRWLAVRHRMRSDRPAAGREPLATLADDALRTSTFLAPLLGAADSAWKARLLAALAMQAAAWPAVPPRATLRSLRRLQRRLSPMQRPLLWRAWLDATQQPLDDDRQEVLALAALLLDLPHRQEATGRGPASSLLPEHPPGGGAGER